MSLALGDHLIISRDGKVLGPDDEAFHEFEVIEQPEYMGVDPGGDHPLRIWDSGYMVRLKVIK